MKRAETRPRATVPMRPSEAAATDRLPPQNLEAERSVLGSILIDGRKIAEVRELLEARDFYRDAHQVAYQAMVDLDDEGRPIDAVTLADILIAQGRFEEIGGDDLLAECVEAVPHELHAAYYAGIVKSRSKSRDVLEALTEGIDRVYSQQMTAEEVVDAVSRRVGALGSEIATKEEASSHPLPDRMGEKAFHGVLGEVVRIVAPQTEACREAILGQLLVAMGNVVGPRPFWQVDATRHRANLFLCLIGPTGIARKGTSWDVTRWLVEKCEPELQKQGIAGGLSSGEGLIDAVKEQDGPLLAVETEFARLLTSAGREHSTLSTVLRQAWDGTHLMLRTRNNPVFVENAFVSIIGHMTLSDLRLKMTENDLENGMANRFLWLAVYRDGILPEGGDFASVTQALDPVVPGLIEAIDFARTDRAFERPVKKTRKGRELWAELYTGPLSIPRTGHYAQVTVRAAPMILRLALLYAIFDGSPQIDACHIEAGKAVWDYCDATAAHLFGSPIEDDDLARIVELLRSQEGGLSRAEINRKGFGGHLRADRLDEILAQAQGAGVLRKSQKVTRGRTRDLWLHASNVKA
jgi:hypothetical protein